MNLEQIESCVAKAKSGDDESMVLILEQFRPFIFKTSNKYNIKDNDLYDLVQTCYIALIKAIAKYKVGSKTFSSYAYASIKNALKYLARSNKKHSLVASLNSKITDNTNVEFVDTLISEDNLEDSFIKCADRIILRSILAELPADEFELIFLVYYNGVSIKSYAEKKGMNYLAMIRKKDKIIAHIKEEFDKKESNL